LEERLRTADVIAGVVVNKTSAAQPNVSVIVSDSPKNHWSQMGIEHLNALLGNDPAASQRNITVQSLHIDIINNRFIDFIFPGVLALSILQASLGSAVVLLDAKRSGVLRRLEVTPLTPMQLFAGFLVGRCAIVLLHLAVLTSVAVLFFQAQILASISSLLVAVIIGLVCFMSMGAVVGFLAPSFESGAIITQLLNFPMAFLCGVFFRNENMPHALQWFVKLMPLTYFVDLMRGLIQAGLPLSRFGLQITVLGAWSAVSLIILFSVAALPRLVRS
jgi:ABC-2 type transport system permease protein